MKPKHNHREAFALMTYADKEGNEEVIWNSRDGVTPFITWLRNGNEANHVRFDEDKYAPFHVPAVGDRVWVSMDWEYAKSLAQKRVERTKVHPFDERTPIEQIIAEIAEHLFRNGTAPRLVEVDEDLRLRFKAQARRMELELWDFREPSS